MDYDGENFIADQKLAKYMAYIRYLAIYSQISHILKVTKNCTRKQNIAIYFNFLYYYAIVLYRISSADFELVKDH